MKDYPDHMSPEQARAFQDDVLNIVGQIPRGRVITYGLIATLAGWPSHSRLVGRILRYTPGAERLPCHRVVNAVGRTAPGWLEHRPLLEKEGIHFKQTYSDAYPPAWILAEVLPFGVITNIFSNIKVARIKKSIARRFGLQVAPFESWLTIITLTRNSCCHHARVWNKQNTIRPMLPNRMAGSWITLPTNNLRIYFNLCIIKYFLNIISPNNDMKAKIEALLSAYPSIDINAMGFPRGWENEPLWSLPAVL